MAAPPRLRPAPGHAGVTLYHDGRWQVPDPSLQWWCTPSRCATPRPGAPDCGNPRSRATPRTDSPQADSLRLWRAARRPPPSAPPSRPACTPATRPSLRPWTHATTVELKNLIALGVIGSRTKIEKLCYRVDTRIAVASLRHACHGSVFSAQRASGPPPAADTDALGHAACADRPPPPRRCFWRPIRVCVRSAGALVVAVLFFLPGPALAWTT